MNEIPKSLKIIITVSLLLNTFFLGALSMYFINKSQEANKDCGHDKYSHRGDFKKSPVLRSLFKLRQEHKEHFKEMHAKHEAVLETLAAEEFDSELFQKQSSELAAAQHQTFLKMSSNIHQIAKDASHEERLKIVEFIKHHRKHRRGPPPHSYKEH